MTPLTLHVRGSSLKYGVGYLSTKIDALTSIIGPYPRRAPGVAPSGGGE